MTQIKFGIFNYLLNDENHEAVFGRINNTKVNDNSANKNAFNNTAFTSYDIVIPPTIFYNNSYYFVKRIGVCAFRFSMITSLRVGKFVEEIQYRSVDWCSYLKKIEFDRESALTKIDNSFAVNTTITKITIPSGVNIINQYIFDHVIKLKTVFYGGAGVNCKSDLNTSSISNIYVLPNFQNETFCNHFVTVMTEFPDEKTPSRINDIKCLHSFSYSYLFVFILL